MIRIRLTSLVCALVILGTRPTYADFMMSANARLINDDLSSDIDQVERLGQTQVSAAISASVGGTTATSNATADFDRLHVSASSYRSDASSTQVIAKSLARWDDVLFVQRNGEDVTEGMIEITSRVKGVIIQEELANFVWVDADISIQGAGSGIAFGVSGPLDELPKYSFDELFASQSALSTSWPKLGGLDIRTQLSGSVYNAPDTASAIAEFSFSTSIISIVYLGPDGRPDPSVKISASSGIEYGVPEPGTWFTTILAFGICGDFRLRRSAARYSLG